MQHIKNYDVLSRSIGNLLLMGKVVSTDYRKKNSVGWVHVQVGPEKEKGAVYEIPWLRRRGGKDHEWWAPEVDEQVLIAAPEGDLKRAIIIGSYPSTRVLSNLPNNERLALKEGQKAPAENKENKNESTSHVVLYEDKTRFSYDKGKHIYNADFYTEAKDKTINFNVNAKKEAQKMELSLTKKKELYLGLDATKDKEKVTVKNKEQSFTIDSTKNKEKINITTAGDSKQQLLLDKKNQKAVLAVDKENQLRIDKKGKKGVFQVGKSVIKFANGTVDINGGKVKIDAAGNITINGSKVTLKASGAVEIKGGSVKVKGGSIALN